MLRALKNLITWGLRKETPKTPLEELEAGDIEVNPDLFIGLLSAEREGCPILDTADRLVYLLGGPAQKVYLQTVELHERWVHSQEDDIIELVNSSYVSPALDMHKSYYEEIPVVPALPMGWDLGDDIPEASIGIPFTYSLPTAAKVPSGPVPEPVKMGLKGIELMCYWYMPKEIFTKGLPLSTVAEGIVQLSIKVAIPILGSPISRGSAWNRDEVETQCYTMATVWYKMTEATRSQYLELIDEVQLVVLREYAALLLKYPTLARKGG